MCPGAREWRCWNAVSFNGALVTNRLIEAILLGLYQLDGIDAQFAEMVECARQGLPGTLAGRWAKLHEDQEQLDRKRNNVEATIAAYGPSPTVQKMLVEIGNEEKRLAWEQNQLETTPSRGLAIPPSIASLRQGLEQSFQTLAIESHELGDLMRLLVPEFYVYLVRLCDGGHLLPRASVKLDLAGSIADASLVPGLEQLLTRQITIDLFDAPPQRELIRIESARLEAQGVPQRQIAKQLQERPKQAAVHNALTLHRQMMAMDLTNPYLLVSEPPGDYPKLRRHKNSKYRFEPMDGYQQPAL
jgi:hypothetical protein